jgi:hypothetical protein
MLVMHRGGFVCTISYCNKASWMPRVSDFAMAMMVLVCAVHGNDHYDEPQMAGCDLVGGLKLSRSVYRPSTMTQIL